MKYLGDFAEDELVYIAFNTFDSNDPSASVTITNLADADIKVHKDGNATPITTDGATVVININSITGSHMVTIDTSADAAYSVGSDYHVRIEGTTIDGATVNAWIGHFSIENRFREVDITHVMGTILTEGGAGRLAAAFIKLFDVATPTLVASDVMRGTDGANTTVPDAAGVAPTAVENRQEMDSNSTELAKIGTIPALDGAGQTIGAAIAKLADDNGGADFDATDDSLERLANTAPLGTTMRGTDSAALASVCTEGRLAELDAGNLPTDVAAIPTTTMRGTDNAATAASLATHDGKMDTLTTQVGTAGAGLSDLGGMSTGMKNEVNAEVDNALDTALPASPTTGSINDILDRQEETVVAGIASGTPTTTTIISNITITVDDQFNGRIITFRKDTTTTALQGQQTDIITSTSSDNSFTVTALATAPVSGDKFEIN